MIFIVPTERRQANNSGQKCIASIGENACLCLCVAVPKPSTSISCRSGLYMLQSIFTVLAVGESAISYW